MSPKMFAFDETELRCPVCFEEFVLTSSVPVECPLGHFICIPCLEKIPRSHASRDIVECPICRIPSNPGSYRFNSFMNRCLEVMWRKCPQNCGNSICGRGRILAHIKGSCGNRQLTCPVCKERVAAKDLLSHVNSKVDSHVRSEVHLDFKEAGSEKKILTPANCRPDAACFFQKDEFLLQLESIQLYASSLIASASQAAGASFVWKSNEAGASSTSRYQTSASNGAGPLQWCNLLLQLRIYDRSRQDSSSKFSIGVVCIHKRTGSQNFRSSIDVVFEEGASSKIFVTALQCDIRVLLQDFIVVVSLL